MRSLAYLLLLAAIGLTLAAHDITRMLNAPLLIKERSVLSIPRGQAFDGLVRTWTAEAWIGVRTATYLRAYGRLSGVASRMQAGEYQVEPGLTPLSLLQRITAGEVLQYELTLIEGWRFDQAMAAIRKHPKLRQTLESDDPSVIMKIIDADFAHPEGWFLPETYQFTAGTTDVEFLRRANQDMKQALKQVWDGRAPDLPLTKAYDALILASIIERETAVSAERSDVSGVFVRRLKQGMRLQTDPTVIYGMGAAFDGNIRRRDLRTDTPYNTYTRKGLPPTPICLPGRASLDAAVHPDQGQSLYFVARGDGSHEFSTTVTEHNAAVRKYQLKKK